MHLADELGIERFESYSSGDQLLYRHGRLTRFEEDAKPFSPGPLMEPAMRAEIERLNRLIDAMSREVPTDAPWNATEAAEWDSTTVHTWLEQNTSVPALLPELERFFDFSQILLTNIRLYVYHTFSSHCQMTTRRDGLKSAWRRCFGALTGT